MPSVLATLKAARFLRGLLQGYFLVGFLTGLHHLGASSLFLGELLSAGMTADFLLTLLLGHLADRKHPRLLLIVGELISMLSAILFLSDPSFWSLGIATLAAGLGQRSNGSPGPYAPAEQVLLSEETNTSVRFSELSHNISSGLFGMAAGALLGACSSLPHTVSSFDSPMLALIVLSGINGLLILLAPYSPRSNSMKARKDKTPLSRAERMNIGLLLLGNLCGGLAMGLVDPLIAYWLHLKFHAGPKETGLLMAAAFLLSSLLAYFFTFPLSSRTILKSVTVLQIFSLVTLLLLPLVPSLFPALLLYALRFAALRAPGGIRQALAGLLVSRHHTGLASGLHLSSLALAQSAGPLIAGFLWQKHFTNAPVFLAALSTALSLAFFVVLMQTTETPSSTLQEENSVL